MRVGRGAHSGWGWPVQRKQEGKQEVSPGDQHLSRRKSRDQDTEAWRDLILRVTHEGWRRFKAE